MTTYVRDNDGKFIPASQRPDGTWRKARRVKDGYVPQEEVPLYESKGKQFAKKPDLPVGMCPLVAKAAREKRERQQQRQNKTPGLIAMTSTNTPSSSSHHHQHQEVSGSKKDKRPPAAGQPAIGSATGTTKKTTQPQHMENSVRSLGTAMANVDLNSEEDLFKQLKKLRKKIREIESIEEKLRSGELKCPEQDQLDKVARKSKILQQIRELEVLQPQGANAAGSP